MKLAEKCYIDFLQGLQDRLDLDKEYRTAENKRIEVMNSIKSAFTLKQLELLRKYDDCVVNLDNIVARKHYMCGFEYGRKFK